MVFSLEGGYNLPIIANCAVACVRLLTSDFESLLKDNMTEYVKSSKDLVKLLNLLLSRYWEVFKKAIELGSAS